MLKMIKIGQWALTLVKRAKNEEMAVFAGYLRVFRVFKGFVGSLKWSR